jgi:hypothetical protein
MMNPAGIIAIDWSKAESGHSATDAVRSEIPMCFNIGPDDRMIDF